MEPVPVPGLDMAPGVAFGLGEVQSPFGAIVSDMLELLAVVLEAPAVGDGQGDVFAEVV